MHMQTKTNQSAPPHDLGPCDDQIRPQFVRSCRNTSSSKREQPARYQIIDSNSPKFQNVNAQCGALEH